MLHFQIREILKSVLFIFIDGIGIAPKTEENPFSTMDLPGFRALTKGSDWTEELFPNIQDSTLCVKPIDARLGVDGLPQSGTGQASIFTGVNCAQLASRHYGPFPHTTSRNLMARRNLFSEASGIPNVDPPGFLNAFPDLFFEPSKSRKRYSVTTQSCLDAGVRIRNIDDLENGIAIAADITAKGLRQFVKRNLALISESEAAARMSQLSLSHGLLVFEYFHTDKAGHARDGKMAGEHLQSLDRLFTSLINRLDFDRTTLVIASDHGNLEDLGTKSHTLNPVPMVARGSGAAHFHDVADLTGIMPAIMAALT